MGQSKLNYTRILNSLQYNWMAAMAAPALIVLVSIWVPATWLPFLTMAVVPLLVLVGRSLRSEDAIPCTLIRRYTEYGLAFSALIMIAINISRTVWGQSLLGLEVDPERVPYVPSLIIYPVLTVMCFWQLLRQGRTSHCRECAAQSFTGMERSITHSIYRTQMKFMGRVALVVCFISSAVGFWYYSTYYIDVNFNRPDKFYFCFVPVGLTVLSMCYVFTHYSGLKFQLATVGIAPALPRSMKVRFLVVRDNEMLLCQMSTGLPGVTLWDTPVVSTEPFSMELPEKEAREIFARSAGCDDFTLRRLYRTIDDGDEVNVVYAAFIPDDAQIDIHGANPQWMTLHSIDLLYNSGQLSPRMQYDIHRIFTITMAWKSYTQDGRRLYPIKNYRPTFRLADFKNWDVDYEDTRWMDVFKHNEDRRFWRLRRFWRRLTAGPNKH